MPPGVPGGIGRMACSDQRNDRLLDRRTFVVGGVAALAAPLTAEAQSAGTPPRIAVVFSSSPLATMIGLQPTNPNMRAFLEGLRELGYIEEKNIVIERRALKGHMLRADQSIE
jgi:hypothetical protein